MQYGGPPPYNNNGNNPYEFGAPPPYSGPPQGQYNNGSPQNQGYGAPPLPQQGWNGPPQDNNNQWGGPPQNNQWGGPPQQQQWNNGPPQGNFDGGNMNSNQYPPFSGPERGPQSGKCLDQLPVLDDSPGMHHQHVHHGDCTSGMVASILILCMQRKHACSAANADADAGHDQPHALICGTEPCQHAEHTLRRLTMQAAMPPAFTPTPSAPTLTPPALQAMARWGQATSSQGQGEATTCPPRGQGRKGTCRWGMVLAPTRGVRPPFPSSRGQA